MSYRDKVTAQPNFPLEDLTTDNSKVLGKELTHFFEVKALHGEACRDYLMVRTLFKEFEDTYRHYNESLHESNAFAYGTMIYAATCLAVHTKQRANIFVGRKILSDNAGSSESFFGYIYDTGIPVSSWFDGVAFKAGNAQYGDALEHTLLGAAAIRRLHLESLDPPVLR